MAKSWKEGAFGEPKFPSKFNVMRKAVLQVTDIKTNRNKYYAIELHDAKTKFRVYTHYGRTDDLESNPNAGVRESRYFGDFGSAEKEYDKIYKAKTSPRKGYKELSLVSANIGSQVTRGKVSGELDSNTLDKLEERSRKSGKNITKKAAKQRIGIKVAQIVDYLYSEATNALTTTVNASITANGIETPLGVLTLGQIDKGQDILDQITTAFKKNVKKGKKDKLTELSGDFYTVIPHRFGRSKAAAMAAVIKSAGQINEKQDTLQLMRDMLNVNGDTNVLVSSEIDKKYDALNCSIETVSSSEFQEMKKYIKSGLSVKNIWKIRRKGECEVFRKDIGNKKMLFHGSAVKHWVGILSRGLLLPKIVTTLGVTRTDGGWLGNGIYFGSEAGTARYYATSGKRGTRFMTVAEVALGKMKEYHRITYGINKPPAGYNSCWGNPNPKNGYSEFDDNELVIYDEKQQYLKYLVEFS